MLNRNYYVLKDLLSQNFLKKELDLAHDLVSRLTKERTQNTPDKMVVNFRKGGELTTEEEETVKSEIDRLWKEKFGDDK